MRRLVTECATLAEDDVTDDRFKLEDMKRRIAQDVFELTLTKRVDAARTAYFEARQQTTAIVQDHGNDREKHHLHEIVAVEPTFIESSNFLRMEEFTNRLDRLRYQILRRVPHFLIGVFEHLNEGRRPSMNDQIQTKQLFENGKRLIAEQSWDELNQVIARLWNLVPADERGNRRRSPHVHGHRLALGKRRPDCGARISPRRHARGARARRSPPQRTALLRVGELRGRDRGKPRDRVGTAKRFVGAKFLLVRSTEPDPSAAAFAVTHSNSFATRHRKTSNVSSNMDRC